MVCDVFSHMHTPAHTCTTTLTQGFFQRCPSPPEGVSLEVQEERGAIPIDLETPAWLDFGLTTLSLTESTDAYFEYGM